MHVSVYVTTLHMCYLVTDPLQLVMSNRNKVQVGLVFPHVSSFSLPVVPVELSTYSKLSPFSNEPLDVSEHNLLVYIRVL